MSTAEIKVNSRVVVARSAIPNATSFIGWTGTVTWIGNRAVNVLLDDDVLQDPIMFFKRELDLI